MAWRASARKSPITHKMKSEDKKVILKAWDVQYSLAFQWLNQRRVGSLQRRLPASVYF